MCACACAHVHVHVHVHVRVHVHVCVLCVQQARGHTCTTIHANAFARAQHNPSQARTRNGACLLLAPLRLLAPAPHAQRAFHGVHVKRGRQRRQLHLPTHTRARARNTSHPHTRGTRAGECGASRRRHGACAQLS
jgi:hypothetical protein